MAIFAVFAFHCVVVAYWPTYGAAELKWHGLFRDFHAPTSFLACLPLNLGWTGVSIFFVISGFCIHLSHERSRNKSWKIFFIRRFFRIYPPYLLTLLIFALVFPWTRLHFSSEILHIHPEWLYSTTQLGIHLLLLHNFHAVSLKGINPAFWSIAVEVQLYLLYPLLSFLLKSKGTLRALWITGGIEIGLRSLEAIFIALHPDQEAPVWLAYEPFAFWFSWTIGAVLADAYLSGKNLPFQRSLFLWPLLMAACYNVKPLASFCFTLAALITASLISTLLTQTRTASPTKPGVLSRHLQFAGVVSYSAYLIHMPLLYATANGVDYLFPNQSLPPPTLLAFCLLMWIPILALSYVLYRWIELPSITLGKRFIQPISLKSP